jgi:hypothetical protein
VSAKQQEELRQQDDKYKFDKRLTQLQNDAEYWESRYQDAELEQIEQRARMQDDLGEY